LSLSESPLTFEYEVAAPYIGRPLYLGCAMSVGVYRREHINQATDRTFVNSCGQCHSVAGAERYTFVGGPQLASIIDARRAVNDG
jgi:hypothetical protein